MDERMVGFVNGQRISVLSTVLPNGVPHSATLHFSASEKLDNFVFVTERTSRKCSHFETGKSYPASLVVGFSEQDFKELQMEGLVTIPQEIDLDEAWNIYDSKFPDSSKDRNNVKWVILKFTPTWWRYTEFKPDFYKVSSED